MAALPWAAALVAVVLVALGAISAGEAAASVRRGFDVYLFLIGITGLAAFAATEDVFAWLATHAVRRARGSRVRLFTMVFGIGTMTTALLSNDATIVVLTPAVIAAVEHLDIDPIPYVLACALVANAASFVLPISNPSNLLVFVHVPSVGRWIAALALPSIVAVGMTYVGLRLCFRRQLDGTAQQAAPQPAARPRIVALCLLGSAAATLIVVSAHGGRLGLATIGLFAIALGAAAFERRAVRVLRNVAWGIIPLTASLFVIIGALDGHGGFALTRTLLVAARALPPPLDVVLTGGAFGVASNLVNNLPVALNAGEVLGTHPPDALAWATLVGINLGPNATVFGSLATILWLGIVRRAGIALSPARFTAIGIAITLPTLLMSLLTIRSAR